jgi:hypothetical protein
MIRAKTNPTATLSNIDKKNTLKRKKPVWDDEEEERIVMMKKNEMFIRE